MSGKVKKVEFLKKWNSKWGWNILRNVLFLRIFKLHRELENFLGMIYLSCKVIFLSSGNTQTRSKKIRIIGHIFFPKTLKWWARERLKWWARQEAVILGRMLRSAPAREGCCEAVIYENFENADNFRWAGLENLKNCIFQNTHVIWMVHWKGWMWPVSTPILKLYHDDSFF